MSCIIIVQPLKIPDQSCRMFFIYIAKFCSSLGDPLIHKIMTIKQFARDPMGMLTWIPVLASLIMFGCDSLGCFNLKWYWIWLPAALSVAMWLMFFITAIVSAIKFNRR